MNWGTLWIPSGYWKCWSGSNKNSDAPWRNLGSRQEGLAEAAVEKAAGGPHQDDSMDHVVIATVAALVVVVVAALGGKRLPVVVPSTEAEVGVLAACRPKTLLGSAAADRSQAGWQLRSIERREQPASKATTIERCGWSRTDWTSLTRPPRTQRSGILPRG